MAWPYDARYKSFVANNEISSAFLNDVQDKMLPNYSSKKKIFTEASVFVGTDWARDTTGIGLWQAATTSTKIAFNCPFQSGVNVTLVEAKIYNGNSSAQNWTIEGYIVDANFETHADAPAAGSTVFSVTASMAGGTSWDVISSGTVDLDIGNDYVLLVAVGPPTHVDDSVYGVRVTYYPLG